MTTTSRPRLPGTPEEIAASPRGKKTIAFFDLDGTVVFGFTAQAVAEDRFRRREVGIDEIFRLGRVGLAAGLGRAGFADVLAVSSAALAGRTDEEMTAMGARLFAKKTGDRIFPEARDLVAAHQQRGHTVVMISSATQYQVEPIARELGIDHVVCNRLEVDDEGVLTGEVRAPIIWGESKAEQGQAFAAAHGGDLARSFFYADGDEDAALMHLVGNPRPTNPRGGLEKVAKRRGWPILRFESRGKVGITEAARTVIGLGALGPTAAGGLLVGAITRRKRAGVDFFVKSWIDALFLSTGVTFHVQGEENLHAQRPAVFIFNHRNNIDVVMAAKLIGTGYTAVGKKEAADNPIGAVLGNLLDAVFIDRADTANAVEALKPVQAAVERGLSLLISPEGTRSKTREVLPFKKGPFRIAMATGTPIVPIIFRNADEIATRSEMRLRPGRVDAVVLPPISTDDWTVANLVDKIEGVRQQYIDTLADWPAG
ncbi:MAG: HAD-IB family hydrolase [Actinomycetota bacterium]|nr:HAD-IB family hydrolase [Actinomycetota bacterium]